MKHKRKKKVACYLRMHRRLWGLNQRELCRLLGIKSSETISRIENGKHKPSMRTALACEVLFGVSPSAMFPSMYEHVEERVMRDVYQLHEVLGKSTRSSDARKRELFSGALDRAITKPNLS